MNQGCWAIWSIIFKDFKIDDESADEGNCTRLAVRKFACLQTRISMLAVTLPLQKQVIWILPLAKCSGPSLIGFKLVNNKLCEQYFAVICQPF